MEHLALEVFDRSGGSSQFLHMPDNVSIKITDTSEIFSSGDVWSFPFTLNVYANMRLFGTSGEIHGARLHEQLDRRQTRLWMEGLPFRLGWLRLKEEVDVDDDGNVDVTFESRQKSFDERIEELNARDVPMLGNHLIGVAAWRDRCPKLLVSYQLVRKGNASPIIRSTNFDIAEDEGTLASRWPKRVIHSGTFYKADGSAYTVAHADTINTDNPYDDDAPLRHPYCNVNVGYQKKDKDNNPVRGYTVHEVAHKTSVGNDVILQAWPNSAPCFYAMYWLRALLAHLGIHIEENQMQDVTDLRRLFLMNTLCAYEEPDAKPSAGGTGKDMRLTGLGFGDYETDFVLGDSGAVITKVEETPVGGSSSWTGEKDDFSIAVTRAMFRLSEPDPDPLIGHPAYASSDCFPDVPAADIINALRNAFGVRLLFNDDYTRVRIVMLRNIFRSQEVQTLHADVLGLTKTESNLRGFMMTYGGEGTAFSLPLFDNKLAKERKAGKADTTGKDYVLTPSDYGTAVRAVSGLNKHLYYTPSGNAYAYKIDEEAKRYYDFRPSLLEVAEFMDAVDGDCTGERGTYEAVTLAFTPLIVNDANNKELRPENRQAAGQRFFAFVDEDMNSTSYNANDGTYSTDSDAGGTTEVNGDIVCGKIKVHGEYSDVTVDVEADLYVYETRKYHLRDNFPQNDDGVSPIETHDWGLTLGIMRGSGSDARVRYTPDPDDHEANDTWNIQPGSSATAHPDTCNDYGEEWDYNGSDGTVIIRTAAEAGDELPALFPASNAPFYADTKGYIDDARLYAIYDDTNTFHPALLATKYSDGQPINKNMLSTYLMSTLYGKAPADILAEDSSRVGVIVELDSTQGRRDTLLALCRVAYGGDESVLRIDNGVGSRYGRFSLKLRAEKPNPDFDASQPESAGNRRFLNIDNQTLRGRGLADQFYKEYSKFIREARVATLTLRMDVAELLAIDKTKRVAVGDVTGFVRKMEYEISIIDGLGPVTIEVLYI